MYMYLSKLKNSNGFPSHYNTQNKMLLPANDLQVCTLWLLNFVRACSNLNEVTTVIVNVKRVHVNYSMSVVNSW